MHDTDVGKRAFTLAIFEDGEAGHQDRDSRCLVCGKVAQRMLRFVDFTKSEPLEMRWCTKCWQECLASGKLDNPLRDTGVNSSVTPAFLVSKLNLTELPLPDALERLYGVCEKIKGGCIRCREAADLPLVGPVKIKSQPLGNTLDSMLGPVGLKWEISHGVVFIAPTNEDLEKVKRKELGE